MMTIVITREGVVGNWTILCLATHLAPPSLSKFYMVCITKSSEKEFKAIKNDHLNKQSSLYLMCAKLSVSHKI